MRAATSSARRSKVTVPPECTVRPAPRVSGAMTRKRADSVAMCEAYEMGTPVQIGLVETTPPWRRTSGSPSPASR